MANHQGKQAKSEAQENVVTAAVETPAPVATTVEASVAEPVVTTVPATVEAPAVGGGAAFDATINPAEWTQKSVDFWSESALALINYSEEIAKAKTLDDVTDLQSRFFSARLDALMRHSTEWLTLAQRVVSLSVTPIYGARAA